MAEAGGFQRIVVAVDGSAVSLRAAGHAVRAARLEGAELTALHIIPAPASEVPGESADYYEQASRQSRRWMKDVEAMATASAVRLRTEVVVGAQSVVDAVIGYAETTGADLIVTGTRGRTPSHRIRVGSVASALVEYASCAVLVVR